MYCTRGFSEPGKVRFFLTGSSAGSSVGFPADQSTSGERSSTDYAREVCPTCGKVRIFASSESSASLSMPVQVCPCPAGAKRHDGHVLRGHGRRHEDHSTAGGASSRCRLKGRWLGEGEHGRFERIPGWAPGLL